MAGRKKAKELVQYRGLGRRKSSTCRVILRPGTGNITVNGRDVNEYMPYPTLVMDLKQPLVLTSTAEAFDVICNVNGGGLTGQSGAIRHGIARALIKADETLRPELKKAGFLERDARKKERKKPGLKKARKAPQFRKR